MNEQKGEVDTVNEPATTSKDLDETTPADVRYARHVDRGSASSRFDFPDIQYRPQQDQPKNTTPNPDLDSTDQTISEDDAQTQSPVIISPSKSNPCPRTLLTLAPELRNRIYRSTLSDLSNASVSAPHSPSKQADSRVYYW